MLLYFTEKEFDDLFVLINGYLDSTPSEQHYLLGSSLNIKKIWTTKAPSCSQKCQHNNTRVHSKNKSNGDHLQILLCLPYPFSSIRNATVLLTALRFLAHTFLTKYSLPVILIPHCLHIRSYCYLNQKSKKLPSTVILPFPLPTYFPHSTHIDLLQPLHFLLRRQPGVLELIKLIN